MHLQSYPGGSQALGLPIGTKVDIVERPLTMRMEVEKVFASALDAILAKKQSARQKPATRRVSRASRDSGTSSCSPSQRKRSSECSTKSTKLRDHRSSREH